MPDAPPRRARIADVAREAGVSKAAVSFAFNNPDRLKPATADHIRQVASSLGYRPHPVARMLTAGSTATIGILSPQALSQVFANPFFSLFAEGVATVTEDRGFGLLFISPLHGSLERAMARAPVDGLILIGLNRRHPEFESIRRAGLPTVLVVGFEDLPLTRFTDPPLTTVHRPVRRKGEEAARMLLGSLGSAPGRAVEHKVLETRLVLRRSTAPVATGARKVTGAASGMTTGGVK